MQIENIIDRIRQFIRLQIEQGRSISKYQENENYLKFLKNPKFKVELDKYKEIILQEETKLELGGANKKSFSLIYPLHELEYINNGMITLIGPEIKEISEIAIDFGIFVLIGFNQISEKDFDNLRHLNFISNGIEGFMIRTIPRRFWCRISSEVIERFSFEILGKAIIYLYKQKFGDLIKSMEILFISSYPDSIEEFIEITSDIRKIINEKWKEKIDKWKKLVDCDYDWECAICPYVEKCNEVREVLEERNKMEN